MLLLLQPATRRAQPFTSHPHGVLAVTLLGLGLAFAGYWPTLRSVAPRLAVDAAFLRAIEPNSASLLEESSASQIWVVDAGTPIHSNGRLVGTRFYRVNVHAPNPWGGNWDFRGDTGLSFSQAGIEGVEDSGPAGWRARDIPVRVDRATSPLIVPIAFGQDLLLVVAGLACAVFIASRPPRCGSLEVAGMLAGLLFVVAPATSMVEFVRVRPWLAGDTMSAWRAHGTIALAVLTVLAALRVHCRVLKTEEQLNEAL